MKQEEMNIWICKTCWENSNHICKIAVPCELIPQHCPFKSDWKSKWIEEKEEQ